MIDTSDNVKPEEYTVLSIFAKMDYIEFKTNKMLHENKDLKDVLELWNTAKLKDCYFLNVLNLYIDERGL